MYLLYTLLEYQGNTLKMLSDFWGPLLIVDLLTHHFSTILHFALKQIQNKQAEQIALVNDLINDLLELMRRKGISIPEGSQVVDPAKMLTEVLRRTGLGEANFPRPTQSLRQTGLPCQWQTRCTNRERNHQRNPKCRPGSICSVHLCVILGYVFLKKNLLSRLIEE